MRKIKIIVESERLVVKGKVGGCRDLNGRRKGIIWFLRFLRIWDGIMDNFRNLKSNKWRRKK